MRVERLESTTQRVGRYRYEYIKSYVMLFNL